MNQFVLILFTKSKKMIIEKIATVDLISDNGNNLYQLNQTYYLRQNNIDILNMEVAAISFNEQFGNNQFPLVGAAFFISIVDKNNKIRHVEITPDITVEPDYDKILNVVDSL